MSAVDQLAELVVRGLIVSVEGLQAVNLLLHLCKLGQLLFVGLLQIGRLCIVGVELRFGAATLRLQEMISDEFTYLLLQHVRGVAVARRNGRAALEGLGQLRVHLDEQIPVLRHLLVAGGDALADPVNEGLADDGCANIDHPGSRKLVYLVPLVRHKEMHGLELGKEVNDFHH